MLFYGHDSIQVVKHYSCLYKSRKSPCIIIIIIVNEQKLSQGDYFNQYSLKVLLTYNWPDVGTLCLQRVCPADKMYYITCAEKLENQALGREIVILSLGLWYFKVDGK